MIENKITYLNPHHLQLKHLHLNLGLRSDIGGKTWAEGDAIWVHALVVRKTIDRTIDRSSYGYIPILRDVLVEYLGDLVILRKRGGVRRKTTEIKSDGRRRGFKGG